MNISKALPAQLPKLRFLDRFMAQHAGYIAGGCFKGLFTGEKIKDVDVFFLNEQDANFAINIYQKDDDYLALYTNNNVTGFLDTKTNIKVELITGHYGAPEEMISNFDFTITKSAYIKNKETGEYEFIFHERFFEHLINKKLVIDDKIPFPLSTFNRSLRYTRYGFNLCGESKSKIVESVQGIVNPQMNDFYAGID